MGILGIENRTENWKTARYFAPFFSDEAARLQLAKRLGEPDVTQTGEVRLELYWRGMRDELHKRKHGKRKGEIGGKNSDYFDALSEIYKEHFRGLREKVSKVSSGNNAFKELKEINYNESHRNFRTGLGDNLVNTEIDVVLDTPKCLFIGEAKDESGLGANGNIVLVHQLIRQHVMAKILVDFCEEKVKKEVCHFLVVEHAKRKSIKNTEQVKFMVQERWLLERNILTWEDIQQIAKGS